MPASESSPPRPAPALSLGMGLSYFRVWLGALWRREAQYRGAVFEGAARFEGRPVITLAPDSRMIFGPEVSLNSATRSNPLGCFQPCVLRTLAPGAELILGAKTGFSGTVIGAGRSIRIGEGTIAGSGAMILDNDFHELDPRGAWRDEYVSNARPVRIGSWVFIGARAIILKGVTIGDRALIGAGAVVTQDVPADHIAAGNPARVFPKKPAAEKATVSG